MPGYTGKSMRTTFGKNVFLRSTIYKADHGTLAASTVPTQTIDGVATKILQPGVAIAKITSGPEIGKVGPVDQGATDGRQTEANFVGLNNTFLPWQLNDGDREIAFVYDGSVIQARCTELAAGAFVTITQATVTALRDGEKTNVTFHVASTEAQDHSASF